MKTLCVSVSALALGASAAMAQPVAPGPAFMGNVYAAVGILTADPAIADNAPLILGLGGAVNAAFGTWNVEIEVDWGYFSVDIPGMGDISTRSVTGHVYNRSGSFAWGGFVGAEQLDLGLGILDMRNVGVEAAWLGGSFVVIGQAQYSWLEAPMVVDTTAWRARLLARYFVNPDFKIEAGIAFTSLDDPVGEEDALVNFEAEVEYLFRNGISAFAAADHIRGDDDSLTKIVGGIRYHFNAPSLQDQSLHGALFDTINFQI